MCGLRSRNLPMPRFVKYLNYYRELKFTCKLEASSMGLPNGLVKAPGPHQSRVGGFIQALFVRLQDEDGFLNCRLGWQSRKLFSNFAIRIFFPKGKYNSNNGPNCKSFLPC